MKGRVNAFELKSAVNWASGLADSNAVVPICSTVVLRFQRNRLQVQSTDLTSVATGFVRAKTEDDGGCLAIEAKSLREYLSKVGTKKNTIISIDGGTFTTGGVSVEFSPVEEDSTNLPPILSTWEDIGGLTSCIVNLPRLRLGKVSKFVQGLEGTGTALESIFAEILESGRLRISAADGMKLIRFGPEGDAVVSGLIPSKAVDMMSKMTGSATFVLGDNFARLSTRSNRVDTSLNHNRFPDLDEIIPTENPMVARFNTAQLKEALDTLSVVAEGGYIKLLLPKSNAVHSTAILAYEGSTPCTASLPTRWKYEDFYISFDAKLMLDVLELCEDTVALKLYAHNKPIRIDVDNITMAVMPILPYTP